MERLVKPEDKVCYCFHISKRKILNHIRIHQPRVASQISDCGGAGTGCGWCIPFLKRYFEQSRAAAAEGEVTFVDDIAPEEYAAKRAEYVRAGHGTPPKDATPLPD